MPAISAPPLTTTSEWFDLDDCPWRFIYGKQHTVTEGADNQWRSGEIAVQAEATQYATGRLTDPQETEAPGIKVDILSDDRLTPDQARRLAAALVAAADEVDGWNS